MKIGISACLLGDKVRYDGSGKANKQLIELLEKHETVKICPEVSAGFPIPRSPIEIMNDKVKNKDGEDLTDKLYQGSYECFEKIKDCDFVILKTKSPSCGYGQIYDGTFSGRLIKGDGIFTQLCLKNNIRVFTETQIDDIINTLKGD